MARQAIDGINRRRKDLSITIALYFAGEIYETTRSNCIFTDIYQPWFRASIYDEGQKQVKPNYESAGISGRLFNLLIYINLNRTLFWFNPTYWNSIR
jgi:hypothetical protein